MPTARRRCTGREASALRDPRRRPPPAWADCAQQAGPKVPWRGPRPGSGDRSRPRPAAPGFNAYFRKTRKSGVSGGENGASRERTSGVRRASKGLKTVSECVKSRISAPKTVCGISIGNPRFLLRRRHFFIFSLADGGGVFSPADGIRKHRPAPDRRHESAPPS